MINTSAFRMNGPDQACVWDVPGYALQMPLWPIVALLFFPWPQ